ncbi:hypothetical protein MalM25_05990 [Planctomycetes bacterium MalM25]|nr:hypothetical protein MalM25_05990 [Planctomycetes bacterium MalM25]
MRLAQILHRPLGVRGVLIPFLVAACCVRSSASTGNRLTIERVVDTGVNRAVYATHSPDPLDANKLFTVHQGGQIRVVDLETNSVLPDPFLTVPGGSGESGLVGLAFHPNYAENGRFFINRHDGDHLRIEEYQRGASSNVADPDLVRPIWTYTQFSNSHNAGWIGFSPKETEDGKFYLWRTLGDGGGPDGGATPGTGEANNPAQHDPYNRSQTLGIPHGHVIRIDVGDDTLFDLYADPDNNYSIPSDNPFAVGLSNGTPHVQGHETYARGLRHGWRASFDRETGDFYIGEVSQDIFEEINVIPHGDNSGLNFGWRLRDGTIPSLTEWDPPVGDSVGGPLPENHAAPVYQYWHTDLPNYLSDPGTPTSLRGNSVTGGFVYRGPVEALDGYYFFGDYGPGRLWSMVYDGSAPADFDGANVTDFIDWNAEANDLNLIGGATSLGSLSAFGEDQAGNVYLVRLNGEILRITDAALPTRVGDFNSDGVVDAADYTVWRDSLGETGPDLPADANLSLEIDPGDYEIWRANYGRTGTAGLAASGVPEPSGWLLAAFALITLTSLGTKPRNGPVIR